MKPELNLVYLHSEHIGYGHMGLRLHTAMEELGVDIFDGMPGSGDLALDSKKQGIARNAMFCTIASHVFGWWKQQHAHLLTMWEATKLPESMRDNLKNFDTVLVPSQANVELFSQHHDNVHFVPLGIDTERWKFVARRKDDIFFNFLICGSGQRKGTDLVHRAFLELQAEGVFNGAVARLIMKNPKGENFGGNNVEVISGYLPPEDEVALYASAHCYVQPSRGEGWGMQPLQAMAQGIPTILTAAHGHDAFAKYGIGIDATLVPASYMTMFGDSGDWWEPDYTQLKSAMRDVYKNYQVHEAIAAECSVIVSEQFTWLNSARAIVDVLGEDNLRERFDEEPTDWFSPDVELYRTVVTRDWRADIGGVVHMLKAGEEYWKPADVKRVLFETGVLTPECAADGNGLTESQLARRGVYVKEHSKCPTCGHVIGAEDAELTS